MKVAMFSSKRYDQEYFAAANQPERHVLTYFEPRLSAATVPLADGHDAVCVFVNDQVNAQVLEQLHACGVRHVALRCAGFNNVDLAKAEELGISVVRVPAYSPHAVAEHTVALMLSLNRKLVRAYHRVREGNFSLEGLIGFDMQGRTAGLIGTGQIGELVVKILQGFGCRLLAYDVKQNPAALAAGVEYVSLEELYRESDIISIHCPLLPATRHLIDKGAVDQMRPGVMLINTSRGAIIETAAVIDGLKRGQIGYLGIDVYEEEADLFFEDLSDQVLQDDIFARLLTFPNVIVTGHQAFLTTEALKAIAQTTLENLATLERGEECANAVQSALVVSGK